MSRKRDTNWNRDEITVLLDSIMEITKIRADDGRRTNSREVFEYAARKLGEKGHTSRAEREKCRTKWKKMKEEFTHARKAREGDIRYKEAPGIQPFYDRMEEFINGNFDNISPHSTIVRRSSSISSSNNTNLTATTAASSSISSNGSTCKTSSAPRSSARIAANNTIPSNNSDIAANDMNDLSSTTTMSSSAVATQQEQQHQQLNHQGPSETPSNLSSRQPSSRLSSGSDSNTTNTDNLFPSSTVSNNCVTSVNQNTQKVTSNNSQNHPHQRQPSKDYPQAQESNQSQQAKQQAIPYGEIGSNVHNPDDCNSNNNGNNNNSNKIKNSQHLNHHSQHNTSALSCTNTTNNNHGGLLNHASDLTASPAVSHQTLPLAAEHADISYRVSSGCRQITIFGDHDVDIKFRGDCVTINKISNDYNNCSASKAHLNNNHLGTMSSGTNPRMIDGEDCI